MRQLPSRRKTRWFATPLTLLLAGGAAHAQSTEGLGIPSRPAEPPPEV